MIYNDKLGKSNSLLRYGGRCLRWKENLSPTDYLLQENTRALSDDPLQASVCCHEPRRGQLSPSIETTS